MNLLQKDELRSPDELIELIKGYNPRADGDLIRGAYKFGAEMHEGQYRHSGEQYFTHPIAVAYILADMQMDDATIITALLHDTVEDTRACYRDVAQQFGSAVADLVDGVTKLTNLQLTSSQSKQAENFRKLFVATSKDLRVILVKLADRLHNMRTIKSMRPDKQVKKARETMEIFAPMAGRMGMQWMRDELEDLAFQVLNPEARTSIMRRFLTLQKESGDVIQKITFDMRELMRGADIPCYVTGRAKRPYSIWRKMETKHLSFSRLADIYGFRIIVENEADCYRTLGVIHQHWRAVPDRFKDYISQPKSNGYRSLHTAISGRDGKIVEVQIRTREMHDVAETGVAAHWSYKNGERVENRFAVDPVKWLKTLSASFEDGHDDDEFLEAVKMEMYSDQVFCFTPKGEVINLPRGATPLDFAYAIHTRIGHACVSAKIDGMRQPLWTRLKNGQSVSIVTAEGQRPQPAWVDIVNTGRAKSAIRRALREENLAGQIRLGQELVRVAFENDDRKLTDKALDVAAHGFGLAGKDELLAAIGRSEISTREVLSALFPNASDGPMGGIERARAVVGLEPGQFYRRAPCCRPLPGERIVGITSRGTGVTIHNIDCPSLAHYERQTDRWLDLRWQEGEHQAVHAITLELTISNDAGVLGRVCSLIGQANANISDMKFEERKPDFYRLMVDIELRDSLHLHQVFTVLSADNDVSSVERRRTVLSMKHERNLAEKNTVDSAG